MKDENPALVYRQIAKKIVAKLKESLVDCLEQGRMPDSYWKLEQAVVDALRVADSMGCERTRAQFSEILKDFSEKDGTSIS